MESSSRVDLLISSSDDVADASWDDFYGSSSTSDLVPTLMDIFDSMIGQSAASCETSSSLQQLKQEDQQQQPTLPTAVATANQFRPGPQQQQQYFPVLKIVEPGDPDSDLSPSPIGLIRSNSRTSAMEGSPSSSISSARRSVSFRSSTTTAEKPPSASSSTSLTSSISSSGGGSNTQSTTCLTSAESLDGPIVTSVASATIIVSPGSPSRRMKIDQQQHHDGHSGMGGGGSHHHHHHHHLYQQQLRHSGDSGDSGVSSPGPPSSEASHAPNSDCGDSLSYMDRVVMEVVESEAVYVRDLQQVVQGYLYYWRDEGEQAPLTPDQASALFGNVDDIYRFNSQFLGQLQSCGLDPVEVARCFVRNNSGFTIYTDYCTNYPRKVSVLTDLMRNEAASRACRERQTELQHTLPLGSYLLKPVQRILKYHLLLQNIVKHCDRSRTPGYSDIIVALSAMTGIAHHINDMKRKHEHAVRVQEVQSLLDGWPGEDLTTYGELVAEGSFRMYGAKAPRHVFLLDRMLLIVKRKEDGTLGYKAHIMCSNLMLIESVPGEPLSFHVIPFDNPRQQYTLEARNLEQKREWALQLKRVILENYDAVIPHHARQLVLQLGQEQRCNGNSQERQSNNNQGDGEGNNAYSTPSTGSSGTKRHQHSAPEYLERRKHSTASISSGKSLRSRKSRKSLETSSPRESPLIPRRLRRSLESRDRSVSHDRDHQERKYSTHSCPSTVEVKTKGRKFGAWRRRSEPSRDSSLSIVAGSITPSHQDETISCASGTHELDEVDEQSVAEAEAELGNIQQPPTQQRIPESLERIVEQLVLQNVEIQRILQRKKRRVGTTRTPQLVRSTNLLDEGIYDSLTTVPQGIEAVETFSDTEGDYVTIRPGHPAVGGHYSRSSMRRESLQPTSSLTGQQQPQLQRATLNRSLSCPARGHPSVRVAVKSPANNFASNTVSSRIQKLLNQIGSPDHWSNWIRSLSPPQRQVADTPSSSRRYRSQRPELDLAGNEEGNAASDTSPCVPSVWLRMQSEHLAEPNKKSGSLPRSFQMPAEGKSRWMDRPVTIASDRPAPIDLQTDSLELYLRSQQEPENTGGLDDSLTDIPSTPRVSTDNIHVHPDYKIYRRHGSKSSLRTVLSSVSAKLSSHWGSIFSLNTTAGHHEDNPASAGAGSTSSSSSRNRVIHYLARQYAMLLKQQRGNVGPTVAAHSATVGARMASAADPASDYAVLKYNRHGNPSYYSTSRSDLSSSKSITSLASKTTWYGTLESTRDAALQMMMLDSDESDESDQDEEASDDFFYERAFEAVEQLLDADWCCRDSAIFSDRDETEPEVTNQSKPAPAMASSSLSFSPHLPPTVPSKSQRVVQQSRRGLAILERMRSFEENVRPSKRSSKESAVAALGSLENLKSIGQRRLELNKAISTKPGDESETSSQHSTSTVNTVVEVHPAGDDSTHSSPVQRRTTVLPVAASSTTASPLPRQSQGWVKAVISKLQGDAK